jgi:arylsulfatase A-like enzyme
MYADGPDALRLKRLAKLQELGLVPKDITPHPVVADEVKAWDDMSDDERAKSARAMEVFAAMVECIDVNVGKVYDLLEKSGELDNTFVCFMSDNGQSVVRFQSCYNSGPRLLIYIIFVLFRCGRRCVRSVPHRPRKRHAALGEVLQQQVRRLTIYTFLSTTFNHVS